MAAELPDFRAVLDMTRIESGRLALSIEPVSADEAVGESLDLIRPLALERRIELPEALHQSGLFAVADRQRLKQVMLNLLANAVKYNNEGGAIAVDGAGAGGGLLP